MPDWDEDSPRLRQNLAQILAELTQSAQQRIPAGKKFSDLTAVEAQAVIDLCAWTHAEWVRIHPFANGNGRTARCWANFIAKRYGLPAFIRLRPRPTNGYGAAGKIAMLTGNWKPTADVFARLLDEYPDSP